MKDYLPKNLTKEVVGTHVKTMGEVLAQLKYDIEQNRTKNCSIIIGIDSNSSVKSSNRRYYEMQTFLQDLSFKSILVNNEPTFHHNNGQVLL